MENREFDLIRTSWAAALRNPDQTARVFYRRLFQLAPETEALFENDLEAQGRKLIGTLGFIVDHLEDQEQILSAARDLAIRHVAYRVKPEDYDAVGAALIGTFTDLLGDEFTSETQKAWLSVYTELSKYMIDEAYS